MYSEVRKIRMKWPQNARMTLKIYKARMLTSYKGEAHKTVRQTTINKCKVTMHLVVKKSKPYLYYIYISK